MNNTFPPGMPQPKSPQNQAHFDALYNQYYQQHYAYYIAQSGNANHAHYSAQQSALTAARQAMVEYERVQAQMQAQGDYPPPPQPYAPPPPVYQQPPPVYAPPQPAYAPPVYAQPQVVVPQPPLPEPPVEVAGDAMPDPVVFEPSVADEAANPQDTEVARYCVHCGAATEADGKFCIQCGNTLA